MKKTIGIIGSLLCMLLGLYSFYVILLNVLLQTSIRLSAWEIISIVLVTVAMLCCGGIVFISLRNTHIKRFNADIFSTICLFFAFMFSFLLPSSLLTAFGTLSHSVGFGPLHPTIQRISVNGVGVYEAFFFLSLLSMGLTIGEGDKKSSY